MAIDTAKIKAKFEEEQRKAAERAARGDFQKVSYWKPEPGTSKLRIMPPWTDSGENADQFWRELYMHWSIGEDKESQRSFSCTKLTPGEQKGSPCMVCSYVENLKTSQDPVDAATAKDFRARQQFYMNVVDLEDPVYTKADVKEWEKENKDRKDGNGQPVKCTFKPDQTKVQVWSFGVKVFRDIISIFNAAVSSGIDISDLEEGRNILVTRTGKGVMDTTYQVTTDFNASVFEFDVGGHEYVEDCLYNLDSLSPFPSEEKILEVLPSAAVYSTALPAAPKEERKQLPGKPMKAKVVEEEVEEEAPKKAAAKSRRAPTKKDTGDDVADLEAELRASLEG